MARTLSLNTVRLYRTVVRRLVSHDSDGDARWYTSVYGPYDSRSVNRDHDQWKSQFEVRRVVQKQELRPVFHGTHEGNLQLGLEWVNYEVDGVKVDHVH